METKNTIQIGHSYEDFVPYCKWQTYEDHDILEIHLQGFRKDQLKVQVHNDGVLTINGERAIDGNKSKSSRFRQEMKVSKDCLTNQIHAKFSNGVLYITMPKNTPPVMTAPRQNDIEATKKTESAINASQGINKNSLETSNNNNVGLKVSLMSKLKMRREKAVKVAVAVAIIVAMVVGGYVTYRFIQSNSPNENLIFPQNGN